MDKEYKLTIGERLIYLESASVFDDATLFGYVDRQGKARIMNKWSKPPIGFLGIGSIKKVKKGEKALFTLGHLNGQVQTLPAIKVKTDGKS